MSHIAEVNLLVQDLNALHRACQRLGLELVRGQQTYCWYGRSVGDYALPVGFAKEDLGTCEHAIRIPGNDRAYEIGIVTRRDLSPRREERTSLVRTWAPTARASTRFLSESQVTMTDRPPESTAFRGSIKFRQNNLLIRREASSSAPTRFWSAATGRSDSSDPLRERPSTNLLPTP